MDKASGDGLIIQSAFQSHVHGTTSDESRQSSDQLQDYYFTSEEIILLVTT